MFGKKKTASTKDSCKCTTKSETNTGNAHNTSAQNSNMTSGSRSTKSCAAKAESNTTTSKNLSNANTKSCTSKACGTSKSVNRK